jgi:nucleotide-binding universal stress UspA family protein
MSEQTLLVPLEFPDPEPLPSSFVGGFTPHRIVLLGIYDVPAELDPDERQRREVEAYHTLYSIANQFVRSGETAEVELVMGEDLEDVPTSVAERRDVDAVLVPNPITTLGRVLIPIRDPAFAEPVAEFAAALNEDVIIHTTLLHAAETEEAVGDGEALLSDARERLVEAGFPNVSIDTEVVVADDPAFEIAQAASSHDIVIMGETQEPGYDRVFGTTYESVAEQTDRPIVVVRGADS